MAGMLLPNPYGYQPKAGQPPYPQTLTPNTNPTTAPGAPTFQPPKPQADPRIDQLIAQLQRSSSGWQPPNVSSDPRLTDQISRLTAETAAPRNSQVDDLVAQLMRGEGPSPGDLSRDPEAAAYRASRLREGDQLRGAEADRLAASGVSGSGDFDARSAQIREAAGSDIASFNAGLTGRRRQEMTANALSGAGVALSAADQQRQSKRDLLDVLTQQDAVTRQERSVGTQNEQQLLAQLIGQEQFNTGSAQSAAAEAERLRQANEDLRIRQQSYNTTPAAKAAQGYTSNPFYSPFGTPIARG